MELTHVPATNPQYFKIGEAATYLGVSRATLRNWDKAGDLVPLRSKVGNYRLYTKGQLDEMLPK